LNLYANSGYNSSLVLQPYKNFGASAGFNLSIPIYDGHQKKMQQERIVQQIADLSTLTLKYEYKDDFHIFSISW